MKIRFKTSELEYFYTTPLEEIKGKLPFQKDVIKQFKKKTQILISVSTFQELALFKSLNLEMLKGNLKGQYSIRLNRQYRLLFKAVNKVEGEYEIELILINEISKHYEK